MDQNKPLTLSIRSDAQWHPRLGLGQARTYGLLTPTAVGAVALWMTLTVSSPAHAAGGPFSEVTGPGNPLYPPVVVDRLAAPSFVDIDDDGDFDLFVGEYGGTVRHWANTGDATEGAFSEPFGTDNPLDGVDVGNYSNPSFVDIDGDGDFDLFVGESSGTTKLFANTGSVSSPAFVERTGTANPLDGVDVGDFSNPSFVDIDGDGDFDAFVGDYEGSVHHYANTGAATNAAYAERTGTSSPIGGVITGERWAAPAFVDIDGDGDFDAFIGGWLGAVAHYENTGNASSPAFVQQTGTDNPLDALSGYPASETSFVDIDGDGDFDAFVGSMGGVIEYYTNTGSASSPAFVEQTGTDNPFDGYGGLARPNFVDIDGDGDFDVFIGHYSGPVQYMENTGSTSSPAFEYQLGTDNPLDSVPDGELNAPAFVDIDGDGDFDAFVGVYAGTVLQYENTGSATTPAFVERTGTANPLDGVDVVNGAAPTFVDIDGDSDFDTFIGASRGTISFFRNESPTAVRLADLSAVLDGTGRGAAVRWQTAAEVDSAGFHIWRAESAAGPYQRITDRLIPATGDAVTGAAYSFTDALGAPGKLRFYRLEEIDVGGLSTFCNPVLARQRRR